jgi:GNAT superfamily N-acetyltransferase
MVARGLIQSDLRDLALRRSGIRLRRGAHARTDEEAIVARAQPQFRLASPSDAPAVAALHTDSWRRHYRGVYSDAYLDGELAADRLQIWTDRLADHDPLRHTILAEDGHDLVGFAHTVFDDDPTWGALLDNLHVVAGLKRNGIGSRLLALSAQAVTAQPESTGPYLWVNQHNPDAQAFYHAHGGQEVDSRFSTAPGGVPGRLHGAPIALRYAWPDPRVLLPPQ